MPKTKVYEPEFKKKIVQLYLEEGRTIKSLNEEYQLGDGTVRKTDASVYNPQGIFNEDGNLQFLYKKTGDAQTDLCVLMTERLANLTVENAYCDETSFSPGSKAKVSVQIKNNSSKRADGFTVDIEGTKTVISESLAPGESMIAEADYAVPAAMGYQEIIIKVETAGEIDTTDNDFSLPVGFTDLAVNVTDSRLAFGQLVEIRTANQSCVDTAVTLEVRKGSREGEIVKSIDLGTIAKGELVTAAYLWNKDAENYSADAETLYFNVVSEKPEKYVDDNYDFMVTESYINQNPSQDPDLDEALKKAKNKAKQELIGYKNPEDYREAQKKELIKAVADGENAIDSAKDEAGVEKALSDAKKIIDKIKTNAQLTEEEGIKDTIDITKAAVTLSQEHYIYDGRAKKPSVVVKLNGIDLALNTDYTVSYSNNINEGTANVIITGIGTYTGTVTKDFTISKEGNSKISIAETAITLSQNNYSYDGRPKKPAVTVKLNGAWSKGKRSGKVKK